MAHHEEPSEVRFRIRTPNSEPRRIRVIALADNDAETENCPAYSDVQVVRASALAPLLQADADSAPARATLDAWLGTPDVVVIAGRAGDDASAAAIAARAYRQRGATVSVVISPSESKSNVTADTLRPYATMMVLPTRAGYLDDLLSALGAVAP